MSLCGFLESTNDKNIKQKVSLYHCKANLCHQNIAKLYIFRKSKELGTFSTDNLGIALVCTIIRPSAKKDDHSKNTLKYYDLGVILLNLDRAFFVERHSLIISFIIIMIRVFSALIEGGILTLKCQMGMHRDVYIMLR